MSIVLQLKKEIILVAVVEMSRIIKQAVEILLFCPITENYN